MPLTPQEQAELAQLEELDRQGKLGSGPEVIQEQHPDISFSDRAIAKNFGNSEDTQAKYLKQQHPDLEVSTMQGQIVARRKGEPWRVMDPRGFDIQDISDVGADVTGGIVNSAATAAGGLVGNIPGAMAAGSASGAGVEALRQKIGQYMGIPQDLNMTDVATQGAFGAASPLLFGTGAGAKQIANQAFKKGLSEKAVAQAQRGLVSKGAERFMSNTLPSMGEFASGIPKEDIKTYFKNPGAIDSLNESGIMEMANVAHDKLKSGLAEAKQKVGQQLEKEISSSGKKINVGRARAELSNIIDKLETKATSKNPEVMEQIAELRAARDRIFSEVSGVDESGQQILSQLSDEITPQHAFELQDLLSRSGNLGKIKDGLKGRFTSTQAKADKEWAEGSRKAYSVLNEELSSATEGASAGLKNEYKGYIKLQNNLNKYFSDPEKTYKTLQNVETPSKQYLKETLGEVKSLTGVDLFPEAKTFSAFREFSNPGLLAKSSKGSTSTSRGLSVGSLGAALGYKLGGPVGMAAGAAGATAIASPLAVKNYTKALSKAGELLSPYAKPGYDNLKGFSPEIGNSIWNMLQNNKGNNP